MASLKDKSALVNHDRAINRAHRNSNGPDLAARTARPPARLAGSSSAIRSVTGTVEEADDGLPGRDCGPG